MTGSTNRSTGWMNAEDLATIVQSCDIVAFKRRLYVHYALVIQVSDDGEVWLRHYAPDEGANGDGTRRPGDFRLSAAFSGGASAKAHVRCDSLMDVAEGCLAQIDNSLDVNYPPLTEEEILQRAHSRLGESSYHLVNNNCEHFVRWCRNGVHRSGQVNSVLDYTSTAATVVGNGYTVYRGMQSLRSAADLIRKNNRFATAAVGGATVAAAGTTGGTAAAAVASGGIAAAASSWTAAVSGSVAAAASSLAGGVSAAAASVSQAAAGSSMVAAVSGQAAAIGSSVSGAMASAAGVFGGGAAATATTTGGGAVAGGTAAMVALPLIGGIAAVGGTYYVLKRLKANENRNDLQRLLGVPEENVAKPESSAQNEPNEVHDDYPPELFE